MACRDGVYSGEDFVLVPAVGRRHADIPLHLRPPFPGFEDRPEFRPSRDLGKVARMIGEAGDAGVETETKRMDRVDGIAVIARALGHDGIDPEIAERANERPETGQVVPHFGENERADDALGRQARPRIEYTGDSLLRRFT